MAKAAMVPKAAQARQPRAIARTARRGFNAPAYNSAAGSL